MGKIYGYVYKITHLPTGRYYIGQHIGNKPKTDGYLGSGSAWQNIVRSHDRSEFEKKILGYAKDKESLDILEEKSISDLYKTDHLCKNCVKGGLGVHKSKGETKKRISKALIEYNQNPEVKARKSKLMKKRWESEAYRNYITEKNKGLKRSEITRNRISNSKMGWVPDEEFRAEVSKRFKGKRLSDSHKQKISEALKGRRKPDSVISSVILSNKRRSGSFWFNNGVKEILSVSCPKGYTKGRLKR